MSCFFYKTQCYWNSFYAKGIVKLGTVIQMNVPVWTIGNKGSVYLHGEMYGYWDAPIWGDGRIFLQARERKSKIEIEANATFFNNISIVARCSIKIGDAFLWGDGVKIVDTDFHEVDPLNRHISAGKCAAVKIGNNVWLGSGDIVLKGVRIEDHSVVATGSIVTKDIPSRVIAGGVPAKVIRSI